MNSGLVPNKFCFTKIESCAWLKNMSFYINILEMYYDWVWFRAHTVFKTGHDSVSSVAKNIYIYIYLTLRNSVHEWVYTCYNILHLHIYCIYIFPLFSEQQSLNISRVGACALLEPTSRFNFSHLFSFLFPKLEFLKLLKSIPIEVDVPWDCCAIPAVLFCILMTTTISIWFAITCFSVWVWKPLSISALSFLHHPWQWDFQLTLGTDVPVCCDSLDFTPWHHVLDHIRGFSAEPTSWVLSTMVETQPPLLLCWVLGLVLQGLEVFSWISWYQPHPQSASGTRHAGKL